MRALTESFSVFLLAVFAAGAILQWVGKRVGGGFRSAERKSGHYRAGGGQGASSKLPMTGGPMLILAVALAGGGAQRIYGVPGLWKPGLAVVGFGLVGLLDDVTKYRGHGLSQRIKALGCLAVSAGVAAV